MKRTFWLIAVAVFALLGVGVNILIHFHDSICYDRGDRKDDSAVQSMKILHQAVQNYHTKTGAYPTTLDDLVTPPDGGRPFIEGGQSALMDPWGRPYSLTIVAPDRVVVWTVMPDGERLQWPREKSKEWW